MSCELSAESLYAKLALPNGPLPVDIRSDAECQAHPRIVPGSVRRHAARFEKWFQHLPRAHVVIVFGGKSEESAHEIRRRLVERGQAAHLLEGGIDNWMSSGLPTVRIRDDMKSPGGSRWVTRERPKIDRLACPWLIRRFIDPEAQFFYTPSHRVRADAEGLDAEPYDITDVTFSHRGPRCSFDAFLDEFDLHDPVLDEVANIVRAADTAQLAQSREAPGLLAISLGLSANIGDDILLLEQAMPLYDALYAWRKTASHETHAWPQAAS